MGFDSKLKVNLYHEGYILRLYPEALEKYTRFPKFLIPAFQD